MNPSPTEPEGRTSGYPASADRTRRGYLCLVGTGALTTVAGCSALLDEGVIDDNDAESPSDDEEEEEIDVDVEFQSLSEEVAPHVIALSATAEEASDSAGDVAWQIDGEPIDEDGPAILWTFEEPGEHAVTAHVERNGLTGEGATTVTVEDVPDVPVPMVGEPAPELAEVEGALLELAAGISSPGCVYGIARDGERLVHRGFGWRDVDRTEPIDLDALFRIASLAKPMTAAAVQSLIADGELSPETRVFELLDLDPMGGDVADERIWEITVEHCLEHRLGWDRDESGDPAFMSRDIGQELELDRPATTEEIVRAWMTVPLDFAPGEGRAYANIGYTLLELVIEAVTGRAYVDVLRDRVLEPGTADDVRLARSFPEDRPDREVEYDDDQLCDRFDVLEEVERTPCSERGYNMSVKGGTAGLVATVEAYLDFVTTIELPDGSQRDGRVDENTASAGKFWWGTFTVAMQFENGIDVVAFFNSADPDVETKMQSIGHVIEEVDEETWEALTRRRS